MLNIQSKVENDIKYIFLEGRLDTLTSQELEKALETLLADTDHIVIDMEKVDYITSAGLRILLHMETTMEEKGSMKVIHVSQEIMDIFEVTGFNDILDIE